MYETLISLICWTGRVGEREEDSYFSWQNKNKFAKCAMWVSM